MTSPRVLLSGGGTGGHIFPAVSIAQEIRKRYPEARFLFVGALGRMEMEKVPQAGFEIEGLPIAGFDRGNLLANFGLPFKLFKSVMQARKIVKKFKPDFAIGTGGYASGPALLAASQLKVPIFIQEQNSFPGVTNKFLGKRAKAVFTAYPDMEKYFPKTRVEHFGNPIRQNMIDGLMETAAAKQKLGIKKNLTILSVGGSQGSRAINNGWIGALPQLDRTDYQLLWQTGSLDFPTLQKNKNVTGRRQVHLKEFIKDMATAYSAADVLVSRAGAIAISELEVVGKPVVLIPLPTAAEDHQTKNAQALVDKSAAIMVKDADIPDKFWPAVVRLAEDEKLRAEMGANLKKLAKPTAARDIVNVILKMTGFKSEA